MKTKVLLGMAVALYAVLWGGGMASYAVLGGPPAHMQWAGPVFMTLAAALCLYYSRPRYRWGLLCGGVVGFAAEVLGVWTGFPFGGYEYTDAFAPLLFGVPLVMVCAWAVLSGYVHALGGAYVRRAAVLAVVGALGLTAIDLVLDPVAAGPMRLWEWEQTGRYYGIPVTNFAGWFVTGLAVMGVLLGVARDEPPSPKLRLIGLSMVLFFTAIAFGQRLYFPGCWGVALCLVHAVFARKAPFQKESAETTA